ncbi:MAG: GspE/PulE family protein [Candidatus Pacebacteria bacterium]|nr:GspE/PulE family protein [Candidatus Paceibacterota bacterium]
MPEVSKKITGQIEIPENVFEEIKNSVKNISDLKEKIESYLAKDVTKILEIIFGGAISLEASDVHIEPISDAAKIRIRIDGALQDVLLLDKNIYENILSRIKLLSEIKLNVSDRPQDGRFSIFWDEIQIEIRTSVLPAEYGESIVLRILNPKSLLDMETLGLRKDLLATFKGEIEKPNGMIIVTGPTGSGKTTTLYTFLKKIQKPEIKIITIEDPIEYHLEGISQTQVAQEKGYDFANGLKSIMRQDPDVILVGEIRDLETVDIALQAALTGHLVLTTLHTNDAAGTIARLLSLGAKLSNIGPAINMVIAERLSRRVCEKCVEFWPISGEELKKFQIGLFGLSEILELPEIGSQTKIPHAKGCRDCNFTGYRGRVGIFEAFLIDDEMEKFILTSPSIAALKERAIERGMVTMYQDGLVKVLEGVTTLDEIERITGE